MSPSSPSYNSSTTREARPSVLDLGEAVIAGLQEKAGAPKEKILKVPLLSSPALPVLPCPPSPPLSPPVLPQDAAVSSLLTTAWTDFAKSGDPAPPGSGLAWEPVQQGGEHRWGRQVVRGGRKFSLIDTM